jgi:hypothetical protein
MTQPAPACSLRSPAEPRRGRLQFALGAGLACVLAASAGCASTTEADLRAEILKFREEIKERDSKLALQQNALDELNRQLGVARSISEDDLKRVFYPEKIQIDRLSGGFDTDGKPGDEGVTVYLQPLDRKGDIVKVPGDVTIQLYNLAAPADRNLIGEYRLTVDQVAELWHGKLMTQHFRIKCPWPAGPPGHPEVTIRVTFVDYLTKRVLTAQATAKVNLPGAPTPSSGKPAPPSATRPNPS